MQVKVGTDIIEVNRIKRSIEELGDKFINRIFTEKEISYCKDKKIAKFEHYAARFAAKEATFKAISSLLESNFSIDWKNIQIVNDANGKPNLEFVDINTNIKEKLDKIKSKDVSLSHIKGYAIANVTILI